MKLLPLATELIKSNAGIADRLTKLIPTWHIPTDPKSALEFKMIFAALDRANYSPQSNVDTGEEMLVFETPEELGRELAAWNAKHEKPLEYLQIPAFCEKLLRNQDALSEGDAQKLLDLLNDVESADNIGPTRKTTYCVALAAALIVTGEAFLAKDQSTRERVQTTVKEVIGNVGATAEAIRITRHHYDNEQMKFVAYAAMHFWLKNDSAREGWERAVITLLTSGDSHVLGTIVEIACFYRQRLADAWWRLLLVGLFWSALVLLMPHSGDEDDGTLWTTWLQRLRGYRLRGVEARPQDLDVMRVANGYERLDYSRRVRDYQSGMLSGIATNAPHGRRDRLIRIAPKI